ncbi:MAG TPA: hypothetical protein PLX95_03865 [bacterium]|nr:hypothetical protein [bacterium]
MNRSSRCLKKPITINKSDVYDVNIAIDILSEIALLKLMKFQTAQITNTNKK